MGWAAQGTEKLSARQCERVVAACDGNNMAILDSVDALQDCISLAIPLLIVPMACQTKFLWAFLC